MSINDLDDELEGLARAAIARTKAAHVCPFHEDILIRRGDPDAEKHAYALATNGLKRDGTMYLREDLMSAIKMVLDMAADDECPECARLRDQ